MNNTFIINTNYENIIATQQPLGSEFLYKAMNQQQSLLQTCLPTINLIDQLYKKKINKISNIKQQLYDKLIECETILCQLNYSKENIYSTRLFLCGFFEEALNNNIIYKHESYTNTINISVNIHNLNYYILTKAIANNSMDLLKICFTCINLGYYSLFLKTKNNCEIYQDTIYHKLHNLEVNKNETNTMQITSNTKQNNRFLAWYAFLFIIFVILTL